jgi:hypothetical protein
MGVEKAKSKNKLPIAWIEQATFACLGVQVQRTTTVLNRLTMKCGRSDGYTMTHALRGDPTNTLSLV